MKNVFTLILLIVTSTCYAQINTFYVQPNEIDINYDTDQDSNLIIRNTTTNINKLFLFIGGTGSKAFSYKNISNFAGNLGYDVINLSYPNSVAAASLSNNTDSLAFNKFRQEVCYGTPISDAVTVDSLNSIYTRTVKLLTYLNSTYPTQNWSQYLSNSTTLDWSKIAVGGHSQGGGHASFFAKFHDVERVIMLSSPNDYSDHFSKSANWLREAGATAMNKHFAYLSLLDEMVTFNKQLINLEDLGLYPLFDSTFVDNASQPYNNSHFLYTTQAPGLTILHHNSPIKYSSINTSVWEYMLTSTSTADLIEIESNNDLSIYPNPTSSSVTISSKSNLQHKAYTVKNVSGQTILEGKVSLNPSFSLDFSQLENGIYFLNMDKQTFKIIKE